MPAIAGFPRRPTHKQPQGIDSMNKLSTSALVLAAGLAPAAHAAEFDVNDDTTVGVFAAFEPIFFTETDATGPQRLR